MALWKKEDEGVAEKIRSEVSRQSKRGHIGEVDVPCPRLYALTSVGLANTGTSPRRSEGRRIRFLEAIFIRG